MPWWPMRHHHDDIKPNIQIAKPRMPRNECLRRAGDTPLLAKGNGLKSMAQITPTLHLYHRQQPAPPGYYIQFPDPCTIISSQNAITF